MADSGSSQSQVSPRANRAKDMPEIEASKRKRNHDSVPCLDIIPFSENNNYPWVKKEKMTIVENNNYPWVKKEKMTIKKKKKTHLDREPMDAARWMDRIMKPHRSIDCEIAMKSYLNDVNKSEGFDVRHEPPQSTHVVGGQKISRIYDPPTIVPKFYIVNELRCLSNLAISVYNQNKGTNYDNVQVTMAMRYGCRDEYYNITFKAVVPSENTVIFQTKACMILHRPYQIAEIKFVSEFNGKDGKDKASEDKDREEESDVFGKDSEKLPLHLSEFALEQYNFDQLASSGFTMKQDEMYGGVNVLSWRKRRKGISIYESSTYSIKFKASLPNSTIVKNFRTKLLVSFYGSTAKFEIKYVKPKCPTN